MSPIVAAGAAAHNGAMNEAARLAQAALARGDLIAAYDIASSAISAGDESSEVRHQQILAIAPKGI